MTADPQASQPASPNKPSHLPLIALLLSVFGFCLPPLLLIGIALGIVALVQKKGSQTMAIISVVLPVAALPVMGILAAIAIPNFLRFQARAKQAECKMNLKAAYVGEESLYAERAIYSVDPAQIGFAPERGNRYLYLLSNDRPTIPADPAQVPTLAQKALENGIPPGLRREAGLHGRCPDCSVTILCAGNIDGDATVDVWSISTADRPGVPKGVPNNDVNDLTD